MLRGTDLGLLVCEVGWALGLDLVSCLWSRVLLVCVFGLIGLLMHYTLLIFLFKKNHLDFKNNLYLENILYIKIFMKSNVL